MSLVSNLYRLQQVDSQLDRLAARLAEIEAILENDRSLQEALELYSEKEMMLRKSESLLREAEFEVQTQKNKIEQTESSLYSGKVQNPKELQDLQNESASLKRYLGVLEDRLLEAMINQETAKEEYDQTHKRLEIIKIEVANLNSHLVAEQSTLHKEMESLKVQREAVVASFDAPSHTLYEQLRQQRAGIAVTTFSDNACDSCGSTLPPAQQQLARSANQMARCPSCSRILYGT